MTNIIASIIVLLTTNWTDIGTVEITTGTNAGRYTLQQGQLATNHVAKLKWRGEKKRFTLSTDLGPVIGERRVLVPTLNYTNQYVTNYYSVPWQFPKDPYVIPCPLPPQWHPGTNYLLMTNGGWWMTSEN